MKETPILFTTENVRKVLAGTKTQTRRIVKPQPNDKGAVFSPRMMVEEPVLWLYNGKTFRCPYGQPGNRLWVRETFWCVEPHPSVGETYSLPECDPLKYGGPDLLAYWKRRIVYHADGLSANVDGGKKYPSIHMPKWACRLWLELTDVRVERVQEISEADAIAEGCQQFGITMERIAVESYRKLWDSINGKGSWNANPWVWCLSFKRVMA